MSLQELMDILEAKCLTPQADLSLSVKSGYTCDLLSWVMAHGQADMAWVTVQTHMNVVAVALLMEMACVILPEGIQPEQAMLLKAQEEGMPILCSSKTAFELCALMAAAGLEGTGRS